MSDAVREVAKGLTEFWSKFQMSAALWEVDKFLIKEISKCEVGDLRERRERLVEGFPPDDLLNTGRDRAKWVIEIVGEGEVGGRREARDQERPVGFHVGTPANMSKPLVRIPPHIGHSEMIILHICYKQRKSEERRGGIQQNEKEERERESIHFLIADIECEVGHAHEQR